MPLSCNLSTSNPNCNKFGYEFEWYQCNCCPYGYHIDLDFVRYCDSIGQTERTASIKRRKDRRRQRQSMDVMLGLAPPISQNNETQLPQIVSYNHQEKLDSRKCALIQDTTLNEAVSDFEKTFQRSKVSHPNNLPDVTAVSEIIRRVPSLSSISSTSASSVTILPEDGAMPKEFDSVSIESNGLSPMTLQSIREQMAVSLKRMRQLEEQVKIIPILEIQLSALKAEKEQLLFRIKEEEKIRVNNINYINNNIQSSRTRSRSLTQVDSGPGNGVNDNRHGYVSPSPPPKRRDFGVMCGVLTRNVGVGHQTPKTKTVSTTTPPESGDKWLPQKLDFLIRNENLKQSRPVITVGKGTQTIHYGHKTTTTQTTPPPLTLDNSAQTSAAPIKCFNSIGISIIPNTNNANTQAFISSKTVGVSDDTINSILCLKCTSQKQTVGVNTGDFPLLTHSVSLAQLSEIKPEEPEEEEEKIIETRTIGCQYDMRPCHKYTQYEIKTQSRSCQSDVAKLTHRGVQNDIWVGISRSTDSRELIPETEERGCDPDIRETVDIGCLTDAVTLDYCEKCVEREKTENNKKEETITPSRIPRLNIPRKFERQITYTKIPTPISPGLSGLDLSPKPIEEAVTPFDKFKQHTTSSYTSRLVEESSSVSNGDNSKNTTVAQLSESGLGSTSRREKAIPSKEMQAAMKVLNDSLQKGQTKNIENQLKNAVNIILQEWFKISSLVTADPLDVEDYLDCFEDISSALLKYIVNMVDSSGNTAMHYAVSHGNFDVVSILLDSKVCDINKQNKAGYTSVMLVSLAEMRSDTHAHVVKRLFSLADVNVRAKQHGQTALMLAVSHGRLDMVKMLLEAGADVNIQDEDGSTALMCAAEHGHIEIVKYFLSQKDCDSTIADVDGSTALKIAMDAGYRHIGVLLYAHERNLHGSAKHKRSKSASASPKTPSSPLPIRNMTRALPSNK
ncbi:Ankyrin repeat-containing protein [Oryctes borbonicus]|uniref:Ankyrin repeat-containing protein n=1 Tax=Oryctes borbonicus TaxID=1629725 RepID=A0A0T6AW19_9SCAR|nr:Ankyrin repeat-containing protein [Oryctes borbonicus]